MARALASLAHLRLYDDDLDAAVDLGRRAASIAAAFDDDEVAVDAAITSGTSELLRDGPGHARALEAALETARECELPLMVSRAFNALAYVAVEYRDHPGAERWIAEALDYTDGHDLDLWRLSILGLRLWLDLNRGQWNTATDTAELLIADPRDSPGPRIDAFVVLALVRARRGDPGAQQALTEAVEIAGDDDTLIVQLATAQAEVDWLAGRAAQIGPSTEAAYGFAARSTLWPHAELAVWRHRAGFDVLATRPLPEPIALEFEGRHREAAAAWDALDSPLRGRPRAQPRRRLRARGRGARAPARHGGPACRGRCGAPPARARRARNPAAGRAARRTRTRPT